jgi:hypothetical protein
MVPSSMVRMVVSTQSEAMFGFGLRDAEQASKSLPVLGPTAEPASAQPEAFPSSADDAAPPAG